jgi:uridine kinase
VSHCGVVPAGLDGNPNPLRSPERTAVLDVVAAAATTSTTRDGRRLIAIDGASGTGKSTFADELGRTLETGGTSIVRASIDSFHRPRSERYRLGADSPLGYYRDSHDLSAVQQDLLQPFIAGTGSYRRAIFDEPSDRRIAEPAEPVPATAILVFDGLFLLRPELFEYWSLSVFLTAETRREAAWNAYLTRDLPERADLRANEIAARIERARRSRYLDGQALYEREARPVERANFVVNNDDFLRPQVIAHR